MAKLSTRAKIYKEQLEALGIYDPAFDPELETLAQLERRKTRAEKEWSATAPPGGKPSFLDPLYQVVTQLEREVLTHREALGLTPKALRRLKGAYYEIRRLGDPDEPQNDQEPPAPTVLDIVREKFAL